MTGYWAERGENVKTASDNCSSKGRSGRRKPSKTAKKERRKPEKMEKAEKESR